MGPVTCVLISILPIVPFSILFVFLLRFLLGIRAPPPKNEADHTKPPTVGSAASVDCVFCLSDIEEGEEITDLRCNHLFHRRCLDRWMFAQRRATCPLCRDALLPRENIAATAKGGGAGVDSEDEVEEEPAVVWLFASYYLPWCIDRTRDAFFFCKDDQV